MKNGFTLLELSIVLVIIGLIIGGITAGADLIRGAELNSIAADISKYKVAINTFKLKYNSIPGDMDNAESYWGQAATGTACLTTAGTGTQTCNGDGDGFIDYVAADNTRHESWRAWQHLANAGLVAKHYSGISITGCSNANYCTDPGGNAPETKIGGVSWHLLRPYGTSYAGRSVLRTSLALGNPNNLTGVGSSGNWFGLALIPSEMQNIDSKVDDGVPNSGSIVNMSNAGISVGIYNPNCITGSSGVLNYNLSYETPACNLYADID